MRISEIIDALESWAPPFYQESYDNSRLIVGDKNWECSAALVCLDAIEVVVDEAIEKKANLIIAHHPILFSGLKSITGRNYIERCIIKAIKNDIAIYALHTNLDNIASGVNNKICDVIGLVNRRVLSAKKGLLKKLFTYAPLKDAEKVRNAIFDSGAGHIGLYDQCSFTVEGNGTFRARDGANPHLGEVGKMHTEKEVKIEVIFPSYLEDQLISNLKKNHPYEEVAYEIISLENSANVGSGMIGELSSEIEVHSFLELIKEKFHCGIIKHTELVHKSINTVAVCGGSGSFLLNDAVASKADIFITSDYKYHQFFDADAKIIIADIGHYESEQFTIPLICDFLQEKFTNFAVLLTENNTNPVKYL